MAGLFTRSWGYRKPPLGARLNRSHQLAQGLVGCWVMNEGGGTVAIDSAGINTGTLTNGPLWSAGQFGPALNFDGVNDYVRQDAYSSSLDLLGTSLTLSAWIKPNNATGWQAIVNKPRFDNSHDAPYFEWSMYHEITTGLLDFFIAGDSFQRPSTSGVPNGVWSHVAVTYESNSIKHYINGRLDRTTAGVTVSVVNTNSTRVRIGSNGGSGEIMDGHIDSVRVYNRVLSQQEIRWLYQEPFADFQPVRRVFGNVAVAVEVFQSSSSPWQNRGQFAPLLAQ